MPAVPQEIPGSDFSVHEYVWDRVWSGPAIVVGFSEETGRLAVAEIVQPANLLGRVAHRDPSQLQPYVKLLLPAEEVPIVLATSLYMIGVSPHFSPLEAFHERLMMASKLRGIIE